VLSIKHVFVRLNIGPDSISLIYNIEVFLTNVCNYCISLDIEFRLSHCFYISSFFNKVIVHSFDKIFSRPLVRLNQEEVANDISHFSLSGPNNITKLLISSKIIKEWLAHPLHQDSIDHSSF